MPENFRTLFSIGHSREGGLNLLEKVEQSIREWANERFGQDTGHDIGNWRSERGDLSVSGEHSGDSGFFSLTWDYDGWRLEFQLATIGEGVEFYARMRGPSDDESSSGGRRRATPPSILPELLESFECQVDGEALKSEHSRVSGETASDFVRDVIFGATRRLPIVLVSENRYRTNLLNPEFLHSRLLGLASVVAFDDESAQILNAELGSLGCYGGAVRICWPGCTADSEPWEHRFWRPPQVRELGHDIWIELRDEFMSRVLPAPRTRIYTQVVDSVHRVEREKLTLQLDRTKGEVQTYLQRLEHSQEEEDTYRQLLVASEQEEQTYKQLLEISEADKSRLEKEKEEIEFCNLELESRIDDLEKQLKDFDSSGSGGGGGVSKRRHEMVLQRAQGARYRADKLAAENKRLNDELDRFREGAAVHHPFALDDDVPEVSGESPKCSSVAEAIAHANSDFNHIRCLPNAFETAKSEYTRNFDGRVDDIYGAFETLESCGKVRMDSGLGIPVQEWLMRRSIDYSDESERMKQIPRCRRERTFPDPDNDRDILMTHHIKMFRNELRIHLHWEQDEGSWLIGYIGEHLSTSSDPH